MKIFRCEQIKAIDDFTIKNEPIASVDLMERAALKLFGWLTNRFDRSRRILIFAGPGNNGGDGLALARLLSENRYSPEVYYVHFTEKKSKDWEINRLRLEKTGKNTFNELSKIDQFPITYPDDIIVDAIFGSGLTKPVDGLAAEVIRQVNITGCTVISIDIPSGLFGEDNSDNVPENIISADYTLTFQFPKISFMFADNNVYVGDWQVLPIGLHDDAIRDIKSPYNYMEDKDINPFLKRRMKFDHKGNFGHGLLIAGSISKMGAAILAAKAALKSGIGLITCHIPSGCEPIVQTSLPEAMVHTDEYETFFSEVTESDLFNAIGIGPGIGTQLKTQNFLHDLLMSCNKPIVLDADAINILGINDKWLSIIPTGAILTPHPKEFERIAGKTADGYSRLMKQINFSEKYNCIVVLKGAHSSISFPSRKVFFNSTGNPGMATAGSGDVLTGIILSLLAQGYSSENAAITGVFIHGLAGDIATEESCYESVIASDIINNIGNAFKRLREKTLE
jgi:ADP-dependent NAD(P)H-hydrate dehydratase / NAD(P)H-hydrate epimerase